MGDIPLKVGSYELIAQIGQGGMGVVYKGRHQGTGQVVAVKVMTAESMSEPVLLQRFAQECAVAARLRHPHIVRGLDFGTEGARPYLVMEFVEGQSLGQRIRQLGPLPAAEAVRMAIEIAGALDLAHREKLIHRDVKPDNILMAPDGRAMLTDLGLIKDLDSEAVLTKPGAAMGTIMFTAPEQFENAQQADALCDVYGLGATLYFALTGVAPYQARGNLTLLQKKLTNDFTPPRRFVPSLSDQLDRIVCLTLDAARDRRPGSCREFAELLAGCLTTGDRSTNQKPSPSATERRRAFRFPSSREASFQVLNGEKDEWRAEAVDISLTGICLQLSRRCERNAVLSVEFRDEDAALSITLLARVNWVRKGANGIWCIGCSFGRALTEEELNVLLENVNPTVAVAAPAEWESQTRVLPAGHKLSDSET